MTHRQKNSFLNRIRLRRLRKILEQINALANTVAGLSDQDLQGKTQEFKERLAKGETLDDLLVEAYAVMREADKRVLGLYPFDVQVLGGIALHKGMIAEMKTGEGKTLTATLPLYLNALSGKGAILVTTNPYLACRDAKELGPVYKWMGLSLSVGVEDEGDLLDHKEEVSGEKKKRKDIYQADITYTTASSLGFDYLVDNLATAENEKFLRPFNFVIVDEADAVLLDNAQTPLIIAGSPRVQSNMYSLVDQFVRTLVRDREYYLDKTDKVVYLTDEGAAYAQRYFNIDKLYSENHFELNRHINLALRAHHIYQKNTDYVVLDNEVCLLDNRSGRVLEGMKLQSGLHQAIEVKESVKISKDMRAVASVTFQSLFNMFPKLSGMTGTAKTADAELIATYRLPVVVIPTNLPIQRIDYPDKIYLTLPEKLEATIDYVKTYHARRQPILLISGTVNIAEIYSQLLLQEGIPHNVLTAKNIAKEADIIAEAGQIGAVTVATSLAGRGTDIKLGQGVRELGGLVVVGTERMENRRVDWQLRGRSGRQGDPGHSQFFVSLEDELMIQHGPQWAKRYFEKYHTKQAKGYGKELRKRRFQRALNQAQDKSEDNGKVARGTTVNFERSLQVQRQKVYALRDSLIYADCPLSERIDGIVESAIDRYLGEHPQLTLEALRRFILENYNYRFKAFPNDFAVSNVADIKNLLWQLYKKEMTRKIQLLGTIEKLEEFYRLSVLKAIDTCWVEEVDHLQQLKNSVLLRQIAQLDAIQEFNREALDSYNALEKELKHLIVRNLMLSSITGDKDKGFSIYYV